LEVSRCSRAYVGHEPNFADVRFAVGYLQLKH